MNMLISSKASTTRKSSIRKIGASIGNSPAPFRNDPTFRKDLVERIKKEIAEGTYETEEKWEFALSRLFGSMES